MKELLIVLALLMPCSALAQTETVIYNFLINPPGPLNPQSDLIFDQAGNLYGASYYGGEFGYGTVFQLVPASGGAWTLNTLHQFVGYPDDGNFPANGLTIDEKGNLYGTTWAGGTGNYGTVFEVSPQSDGQWTESLAYYFSGGGIPRGGAVLYKGSLFGTTTYGGANGVGTVFKLSPSTEGNWTATVIYNLTGSDGGEPYAGLVADKAGNLYGTTSNGGANFGGTVFEVSPTSAGGWNGRVLHAFGGVGLEGGAIYGNLAIDKSGNLYGTTYYGGKFGYGTVFELMRGSNGRWTGKTIHNFTGGSDGANPYAGPTLDSAGNVYGTAVNGGLGPSYGTVFELIPNGEVWTERTVYQFATNDNDGINPYGSVVFDPAGNIYGTTSRGGTENLGTVFKIVP
jgi:uncharacterized repeat protein (TIGR03803 family)